MTRRLGHYAPWLLAALIGLLIVMTLASLSLPWPALIGLLAVALISALSIFAHNRRLCERCIASVPLEASATAHRYSIRFRVAHWFEHKLFALGYLVVVVASSFMYSDPIGRYGWALVEASLAYLLLVYVTHQRLQPWCPYCRNGGDEKTSPTSPTPIATRP